MACNRLRQNDLRGPSSAVSSVLYSHGARCEETKTGSYIYRGVADSFHEWEFRTRLRAKGKKDEQYAEAVSKVVDGLRGDAFVVAPGICLKSPAPAEGDGEVDGAIAPGVDRLITAMKE